MDLKTKAMLAGIGVLAFLSITINPALWIMAALTDLVFAGGILALVWVLVKDRKTGE